MQKIIQNAAKIIDGDKIIYLVSQHRHDYVVYKNNGGFYAVDGGFTFFRRSFDGHNPFSVEDF